MTISFIGCIPCFRDWRLEMNFRWSSSPLFGGSCGV